MKLYHGEKVIFSEFITKSKGRSTEWVERVMGCTVGIFLGYRSVQNGHTEHEDGYTYFVPTEYIKCALVSFESRSNPVYVKVENVKRL